MLPRDDRNTLAPFLPASLTAIADTCEKCQDGLFLFRKRSVSSPFLGY